ncbi:hypothetical protein ATCC90586_006875 [Pythium insidiosum]|nr:hypothetical protein ATCC90586_006875 [Pythium insidiosum]
MPQLPRHVLELIFTLVVGELGVYPRIQELDIRESVTLDTLAAVCPDWDTLAKEIRAIYDLSRFTLESIKPTRKSVLYIRRQLTLRRAYLKSLEIYLHDDALCDRTGTSIAKVKWQALGWDALLSLVPRLERLQVDDCVVAEFSTPEIVAAAAAHCVSLQNLVVPTTYYEPTDASPSALARARAMAEEIPRILDAAIQGLESWHFKGVHGGLRELSLPLYTTYDAIPHSLMTALVETMVKYCPQMETICDPMRSPGSDSREQWFIDAALWEQFCASLLRLKEFDWNFVPFTTQFFSIFGQYPKPMLTKLTLSASAKWDWAAYHATVGLQQQHVNESQGFGPTAKHAHAVLRACPALKELVIDIPRREDEVVRINSEENGPEQEGRIVLDQEIFGDDFCVTLAEHCPWVEILEIGETLMPPPRHTEPIMALTDRGLNALSSLKHLLYLQIKATNITGQGLFSLLEHGQYGTSATRVIDIVVGDTTGATEMAFYRLVESFLQCLTQHSGPLTFLERRVALRVMNGKETHVQTKWSKSYLARIKALVKKFKRRSRGSRLNIITARVDPGFSQFGRLIDLQLHTKRSKQTLKSNNWQYRHFDDHIDNVFIVRHDPNEISHRDHDPYLDDADDDEWYDYDSDELYEDEDFYGDGPYGGYHFDELPWEDQMGYDSDGVPYAAYGEIYNELYGDEDWY